MFINMFVNRFKVCKQAEKGYSRLMLGDLQLDTAGKSNAQSELHIVLGGAYCDPPSNVGYKET